MISKVPQKTKDKQTNEQSKTKKNYIFGTSHFLLIKNFPLGRNNLHRTGNKVKVVLQQEVNMAIPRTAHICRVVCYEKALKEVKEKK